jgi:cysteine desulfurase family protein (TIGR01976 family)
MTFDPALIRAQYPALTGNRVWLDGAAGTQLPVSVIEAIAGAYRHGIGNVGGAFAASRYSDEIVDDARTAIADLVGGEPNGVFFAPSSTSATYRMSRTLAGTWAPGDEVVVTQLDHDSNVRPWVQAGESAGAIIKWAKIDPITGELPVDQFQALLTERTKLVAVTAASNILGTKPDVAGIAKIAHNFGALVYVDGVHSTPHLPIDMHALGADFYITSAYKWSGPHIGALCASPTLLETLHPKKLASSADTSPNRFELGTLPFADLVGVTAAVDHLASLDDSATGSRRERILQSMGAVATQQKSEGKRMLEGLRALAKITTYGRASDKTPTAYFNVAGHTPREVAEYLDRKEINVWNGHNYAWEATAAMGIRDSGSAVRAGIVHYNTPADVDRLVKAVAAL